MPKKEDKVTVVTPEVKVAEIAKDVVKLEKKKETFVVTSEEEFAAANAFLIEVKGRINRIEELEETFNAPHQEIRRTALAAMQKNSAMLAEPKSRYKSIEQAVKSVMGAFRLAENKRIADEEKRLRDEQLAEEARQAEAAKEAEAKGEEAPAPMPAPAPLPTVAKVAKTQSTNIGSSTSKQVVKFEITDVHALPKKYKDMILEDSLARGHVRTIIEKFVKAEGMKTDIKGVRVYEDIEISVKTK